MISDVKLIEDPLMNMKIYPARIDRDTMEGSCKLELELNINQVKEWADVCGVEGLVKRIGTSVLTAVLMQSNR